ncbi:unnamed protein product [Orchesella dallaii]|uniref:Uncharacterized protein n=1 Tax=Orchesella dallaii TaxID=48710 RepID=A0ABP1PI62_9HEXA
MIKSLFCQAQIKMTVHYEAFSKPSQEFITKKLYPTIISLGGVYNTWLDVELIPYGLSKTTWLNGPKTTCHNGEAECNENKLHSCAIRKLRFEDAFSYINCTMTNSHLPTGSSECGKTILGTDYKKVTFCAGSWEGDVLLAANGITASSLEPPLLTLPRILLGGHFTPHSFDAEEKDWVGLLCNKWKAGDANLPPLCDAKVAAF